MRMGGIAHTKRTVIESIYILHTNMVHFLISQLRIRVGIWDLGLRFE